MGPQLAWFINLWLRNYILNVIPVSQLANICEDKIYKINFRRNILIHSLFPFCSLIPVTYPQHHNTFTQNWNYFLIIKVSIHTAGSKKISAVFLVSFANHQYGVSKEFWLGNDADIDFKCSTVRVFTNVANHPKFLKCLTKAVFNYPEQTFLKERFTKMLVNSGFGEMIMYLTDYYYHLLLCHPLATGSLARLKHYSAFGKCLYWI